MSNIHSFALFRGYSEILLEEIALEGLDGITLETLWKRLEVNSDWNLNISDNLVKEFVWKYLISIKDIQWFQLKEPRTSLLVFSTTEKYFEAVEKNVIDLTAYSSNTYPHNFINDNEVIGSCSTYYDRVEVTQDIQEISLTKAVEKWDNKLVIVASQRVRYSVLLPGNENPENELTDTAYCILERIGRSRRCGELAPALTFLRNGANPIFYFWNRLKKRKIIKSQCVTLGGRITYTTLFHLPRFYKKYTNEVTNSIINIVNQIKSSPKKACLFSEINDSYFSSKRRITKLDSFRRFIKMTYIPYKDYFPESDESQWFTLNGDTKLLRVFTLVNENIDPDTMFDSHNSDDEEENENGILDGNRVFNRTLLSQCYHLINEVKLEGISTVEIGRKLGLNKLMSRQLLKTLTKYNLIVSLSSENARVRYYRYYSKNYSSEVKKKLQDQLNKTFEILEMNSSESKVNPQLENDLSKSEANKNTNIKNSSKKSKKRQIHKDETNNCAKKSKMDSSPSTSNLKSTSTSKLSLQDEINSKMNLATEHVIPANESMFVMRRINIVLEYIYKNQVVSKLFLSKIISEEESKRGLSQGIPDRKSLVKVINILLNSGKVKMIKKVIKDESLNKSKEVEFLCVPSVDESHSIIQSTVQQIKSDLSILYVKDALNAKRKVHQILPNTRIKTTSTSRLFAPKFARIKILHKLLVYVLYHYQGSENLNAEECIKYIETVYPSLDSNEQFPKCYLKEIGWKMFIPPLMKYEEYGDGWISQNDLAERLPLKLFFSLIRLPYHNPEIDTYLNHPIKQYYLIRHLPQEIQQYLTFEKKYVYLLTLNLRNLCMIGLIQFGPKSNVRGNTNLVYLNKRTELMDTRICQPGHFKINPNLNYRYYYYDFTALKSVETYWNDAMRFCIETKLGRRNLARETGIKRNRNVPQRLLDALVPTKIEEAHFNDNGKVPGDHLGAVGFDSFLYSHFIKQWMNTKIDDNQGNVSSTVSKSAKILPVNKKSTSKLRIFRNRKLRKTVISSGPVKKNRSKITTYDKTDIEALKKLRTLRTSWSKSEDDLLLTCYVASKCFTNSLFPFYKPFKLYRKILHELSEKSLDKTSEACKRRLANLLKNPLKLHSAKLLIKELSEDTQLNEKFHHNIDEIKLYSKTKNTSDFKELLDKLTEAVFYHLYNGPAQTSILIQGTYDLTLPNHIEMFKKYWNYEYALLPERSKALTLNNEKDPHILAVCNLIISTLLSQIDGKKMLNINYLFSIFKQFSEIELKSALNYVRNNRLISYNKCNERQRSFYLPFGKGVYHLSLSYHTILKNTHSSGIFSQIYNKYLELISCGEEEKNEITNYDAGLNLMLISYIVLDKINFQFTIPETVLCFNSTPLPYVDPENVVKPMLTAKESYTDMTLSIIRNSFFNKKSKNENEDEKKFSSDDDEYAISDNDSYDNEDDDKLIDYSSSKIAIFLTRNQFKQSDVRFSNAYDHFLINKYPIKYTLKNCEKSSALLTIDRANFLMNLQEYVIFTKIKYSSDELMIKIRKFVREPIKRDLAVNILEFVRTKGALGATCADLQNEFKDLSKLKGVMDILLRKKIIIRCGSEYTHFVHLDFAEYWLMRTWRNKNIFYNESEKRNQIPTVINRNKCEAYEISNNEQIWVCIKPWIYINGDINEAALDSFLIRVLSFILKKPNTCLKEAQNRFFPALLPYNVRELIEILVQLNCVRLNVFRTSHKVSLLSKPSECHIDELATGFENEENIILEPDVNSLTKLSIFLSNSNYKDLIEVKYSSDMGSAVNQPHEIHRSDITYNSEKKGSP